MNKENKNIYIILGMHKSGTTLVSRLLMEAGIYMGDFDMKKSYDAGNHLEMRDASSINKSILDCGESFSLQIYKHVDLNKIPQEDFNKARSMVRSLCSLHLEWGFKDPRTCLTYSFWEKILPRHRIIAVYRHPSEVISHYFRRRYSPMTIFKIASALQAWDQYNKHVLEVIKRNQDVMLLNFSILMQNTAEIRRLEKFIERPIYDWRDPSKYRSIGTRNFYYFLARIYNTLAKNINPLATYNELESQRKMQAKKFQALYDYETQK